MTESNVLELSAYWKDCPYCWQNYYNNTTYGKENTINEVLLRDYSAVLLYNKHYIIARVVFPDEQTKFEFMLEWSYDH